MKRIVGPGSLISGFLILILSGCVNNSQIKENKSGQKEAAKLIFDQLTGTWASEDGKSFEKWTKENDSSYRSVGFAVHRGDTSWQEDIHVYKTIKGWVSENKVRDENEGKAVRFTSSKIDGNMVEFNNPQHDFPTGINYTLKDSITMNAFIFGPGKNGRNDTILFFFKRVQ